jgi:DnaK suppressor protein
MPPARVKTLKKKTPTKKTARAKTAAPPKGAGKAAAKAAAERKRDRPAAARRPKAEPAPKKTAAKAEKKPKARRMGAAELRKFRKALLDKREDLLQAYLSAKGDSRNRTLDGTEDYIDYAVSSYDREFLLSLTELDQKHLMLVEEALRRIDQGRDYGQCAQCQQEIPLKRLEVQPWARYCLRCQELDEQGLLVTEEREGELADGEEQDEAEIEAGEPEELEDEEVDEEPEDVDEDTLDGDRILSS